MPSPFVLCPIGVLEMAHRDADVAVGRAAAAEGIPFVFSNQASRPMEEVARAMGDAPRWFQLYWSTSDDLVASLVSRAERCGCSAIVLTLDTTMLGWRIRDLDLAYLPFLQGKGIAQYTSDPVFVDALQETLQQASPPGGRITGRAIATLLGQAGAYPGARARQPPLGARAGGGAAVRRDLLAAVALVGRPRLPPRADPAADPAQRDPPSGGRGRGGRARDGRGRRLQPRWAPGRRRDRHDGRAAGRRGGGRRSRRRSSSTAASALAPTCSVPSRWARPRSGSGGRTSGVSRRAARTVCAKSSATCAPTSTSRLGLAGVASVRDIGRDNVTRV